MAMSKTKKILSLVLLVVLLILGIGLYNLGAMGRAGYWESGIREFEAADRTAPPKPGVIVFAGSSSIRMWRTLGQDMALPETWIYFISIKPTRLLGGHWAAMK